jgi:peptidyl-prolyl cis-trans isomerase A (cyclophilin A)
MQMPYRSRFARRAVPSTIRNSAARVVEILESRLLYNATASTIPTLSTYSAAAPTTVSLGTYFSDPTITGTAVIMQTNVGNLPITLDDSAVANTVNNFLHYVSSGGYANTIIHRVNVPSDPSSGIGVIQGGGLFTNGSAAPTFAPIPLEGTLPNAQYTVAMARTSSPDSATDEFFINSTDNSTTLPPGIFNGVKTGYAVFGKVIYGGQAVVNQISALSRGSLPNTAEGNLSYVPTTDGNTGLATASDEVIIEGVTVVSPLTFAVTSDNTGLVVPSLSGGTLQLSPVAGHTGTANITVIATDLGGNTASTTFAVNVGATAPATQITLGAGGARLVRFIDPNGTHATAVLAGPGTATLTFTGPGLSQSTSRGISTLGGTPLSMSVSTTGTTAATSLSMTGTGGNGLITLTGITTDANVGAIGGRLSLTGDLTAAGTIRSLTLANVSGGTITISGTAGATVLNLGTSTGESVTSSEPIQSLQATSFDPAAGGGDVSISAPSITRLAVTKDLQADVTTTGNLGAVTAGSISTSNWAVGGSLASISAGAIDGLSLTAGAIRTVVSRGAITNSQVDSTGNVALISAVSLSASEFIAGVPTPGAGNIPAGFAVPATITAVIVGRGGFSNTVIAAQTVTRVVLGPIASGNGGNLFGVAASKIGLLTATIDKKPLTLRNVTTAQQVTDALTKAGITPNDLQIQIV